MKLVNDVFEIAESFMKNSKHVTIINEDINELSKQMLKDGPPKRYLPDIPDTVKEVVLTLVASSVNYCYWYGRHDIRPCGASSTRMGELLKNSFFDFKYGNFSECLDRFGRSLIYNRFPLVKERIDHLNDLKEEGLRFCSFADTAYSKKIFDFETIFSSLVETFPGFGSDIFLKRASLFFIELNRNLGWFEEELHQLHVPADYQIPKMLNGFHCIQYSSELSYKINNSQLIPKNSLEECEIRAATILTIKKLCELTKWNVADVDGYLFFRRHECSNPFHLTITTDY